MEEMFDELHSPTVLVVDDDDDHNLVVSMSLAALGYETRSASSCAAARAMLAREQMDVLVSDLALGDGTALDLVASLDRRPRVAIVLTGFDNVGPKVKAAFDAVLLKPTAIERVDELLRALLSTSQNSARHSGSRHKALAKVTALARVAPCDSSSRGAA
ncbi:MAG: response regulator [Polyangiaceae bacterium]|nr:response regulator [Polyangiaceae bacterium]